MAVMTREAWTDERLDDLKEHVASIDRRMAAGFAEMRSEFIRFREKMETEFVAVRKETHREFSTLRTEIAAQFDAQNRMVIQLFGGMFATFVIGFVGTIATVLTQT